MPSPIKDILKKRKLPPLPSEEDKKVEWLSTGMEDLDAFIKTHNTSHYPGGGFPVNRVTEIYGRSGVGKTSIMSYMLPKMGHKILYIDSENAITRKLPDNIDLVVEFGLEPVQGIVNDALDSGYYDIIVVDSVASLVPLAEADGDEGQTHMGLKARLMSQWMRTIGSHMRGSNTAVVFVNQERETMNAFGLSTFTPGGKALGYAASLRLELLSNASHRIMDKETKKKIGHKIRVKIAKSRFGQELDEAEIKLIYDKEK